MKTKIVTKVCPDCDKSFSFKFNSGPGFTYCQKCQKNHQDGGKRKNAPGYGIRRARYV
jgi:Zn-finger nucleic acid-binding protein